MHGSPWCHGHRGYPIQAARVLLLVVVAPVLIGVLVNSLASDSGRLARLQHATDGVVENQRRANAGIEELLDVVHDRYRARLREKYEFGYAIFYIAQGETEIHRFRQDSDLSLDIDWQTARLEWTSRQNPSLRLPDIQDRGGRLGGGTLTGNRLGLYRQEGWVAPGIITGNILVTVEVLRAGDEDMIAAIGVGRYQR